MEGQLNFPPPTFQKYTLLLISFLFSKIKSSQLIRTILQSVLSMSKSHPTNVRITCEAIQDNVNPLPLLLSLTLTPESAVIVKEHGPNEKPHIHAYLDARYTEKTIRERIKKILISGGNAQFKVSKCNYEPIRSCRYNCKKVPEQATVLHIGDKYSLEELKEEYHKFSSSGKKKPSPTCVTTIREWGDSELKTPMECITLVLRYYVDQNMPMNKSRVAQIASTIWLQTRSTESDFREVAKCILSEHLPELHETNYKLERDHGLQIDGKQLVRFGAPEDLNKSNYIESRLRVPRLSIPPRNSVPEYDSDIE